MILYTYSVVQQTATSARNHTATYNIYNTYTNMLAISISSARRPPISLQRLLTGGEAAQKEFRSQPFFPLLHKLVYIPLNEKKDQHAGQDVLEIRLEPVGEAGSLPLIGFGDEIVPAPAPSVAAEGEEEQGAEGQQVIAEEEVFQIQHGGAFPERLETGQDVEAERAGQGEEEHRNAVDRGGFFAGPAPDVHAVLFKSFCCLLYRLYIRL